MTEPDDLDYGTEPTELGLEAPEADTAEQGVPADPALRPDEVHRGLDVDEAVDEADALEQSRVVGVDDEER
jgi:hypothetical protein